MIDRVEVYIVDENQPRWLAFLNGEHDLLEEVPAGAEARRADQRRPATAGPRRRSPAEAAR